MAFRAALWDQNAGLPHSATRTRRCGGRGSELRRRASPSSRARRGQRRVRRTGDALVQGGIDVDARASGPSAVISSSPAITAWRRACGLWRAGTSSGSGAAGANFSAGCAQAATRLSLRRWPDATPFVQGTPPIGRIICDRRRLTFCCAPWQASRAALWHVVCRDAAVWMFLRPYWSGSGRHGTRGRA